MATLGRWSGGSATHPTTSWASPNGLGTTQDRNDSSAYTWTSASARLTLPSSDIADGYLVIARLNYTTTHNNRHTHNARFTTNAGTGDFLSSTTGGYSRNSANNNNYVTTWAIINNPSAGYTLDYEWKRDDGDGTTAGSVTDWVLDVIPLYYSDIALYSSTNSDLLGGTTPVTQPLTTTVLEGTNITRSGNVITVTGDNKRYLIFGSNYTEGRGGRTQRWVGGEYDGTQDRGSMACIYHRDAGTDENGIAFSDIIETDTASRTIEQFIYRGDGVANNEGGANSDGSNPAVGAHAMAVMELNDSCEVIRSSNASASSQAITTGTVDISAINTVDFNDSASFTKVSATAVNAEVAMDALAGANIGAAYNTVSSGTRYEGWARFTVNGTEDTDTFHGNYGRGNQSSVDTFGYSANPMAFVALTQDQDIGVSHTVTGNTGPVTVQAGWAGFWAINLDTMEDAGGATLTASGTPSIAEITASGQTASGKTASGTPSLEELTASGTALIGPKVWLNTTQTTVGADQMTVTDWNHAGTFATFTDPAGGKKGDLFLGVENAAGDIGWIAVRVSVRDATGTPGIEALVSDGTTTIGGVIDASGTPSIAEIAASSTATLTHKATSAVSVGEITASGSVQITRKASAAPQLVALAASATGLILHPATGTPSLEEIEAAGTATSAATVTASGSPSIAEITSSGTAVVRHIADGTPSIDEIEASGVATGQATASGTPAILEIDANGQATLTHPATGSPSIEEVTASGVTNLGYDASGTPSIEEITSSGLTTIAGTIIATAKPSIEGLTSSGNALVTHDASGTPSIAEITASATAILTHTATGTPSISEVTADGESNRPRVWLNTTQTKSGATEMTVTAWNSAGTSITFTDPVGPPFGSLQLGVERISDGSLGWIGVTVNSGIVSASGTPSIPEITVSSIANVLFGNEGMPTLEEFSASADAVVRHIATGTPATEEIDVVSIASVTPPNVKTAIGTARIAEITAASVVNRSYSVTGSPQISQIEAEGTVNEDVDTVTGGHFIPGLAGVRAGKKRPWEAKEQAEEVIEDVIREVLEDDTKPIKRVSRKRKSRIIELATQEIQRQDVLRGDLYALEKAVADLSKILLQRRLATLPEEGPRPLIIPETPLVLPEPSEQELASLAFKVLANEFPDIDPKEIALAESMLTANDPDEDELLTIIQMLMSV